MDEVQKLFLEVKKSFPEVNARLKPKTMRSFMFSFCLNRNIYYDPKQIVKIGLSEKALKGVLAHELAHKIDYIRKGFFYRFYTLFKYKDKNPSYKREVERRVDRITIEKGFGEELLALMKESRKKFGKKRFEERLRPFHLTEKEILDLIKK